MENPCCLEHRRVQGASKRDGPSLAVICAAKSIFRYVARLYHFLECRPQYTKLKYILDDSPRQDTLGSRAGPCTARLHLGPSSPFNRTDSIIHYVLASSALPSPPQHVFFPDRPSSDNAAFSKASTVQGTLRLLRWIRISAQPLAPRSLTPSNSSPDPTIKDPVFKGESFATQLSQRPFARFYERGQPSEEREGGRES
ncbi:hypothetical protein PG989_000503 [Apiospora arundinis]